MAPKKKVPTKNVPAVKESNLPAELAAMYAEDAKENLKNVNDAFYRISIQGGRFKVDNAVIGDKGVEFIAIILKEIPVNTFYSTKYDPNEPTNPDCSSVGGLKSDVAATSKQSDSCVICKQNRFGTGTDQEGKASKGKACHNARRLVLKIDGVDMPVLLSLPPTSIKAFNSYLKELSRGEVPIPMFAVRTIFSFDETSDYPRPLMSKGNLLTKEEYLKIKEHRESQEVQIALKAYASPDDYEPEEKTDI